MVTFVPVTSGPQIKAVSELAGRVWLEHYPSIIGKEQVEYMLNKFQSVDAILEQIERDHYQYYLLTDDKGVNVGYLAVIPRKDELFLSKIYIQKEDRKKGYGREALDFVREKARKFKLSRITLTVNRDNIDSIEVYKKYGFKGTDNVDIDIGEGFFMCDHKMEYTVKA